MQHKVEINILTKERYLQNREHFIEVHAHKSTTIKHFDSNNDGQAHEIVLKS